MATLSTVLGNGENRAFIYDRSRRARLLNLPESTGVTWGRELSDVSAATVTVQAKDCQPELADVSPWAHSLVVFRDSGTGVPERVWEGPVRRTVDGADNFTVTASDVLGWTQRRALSIRRAATNPVVTEIVLSLNNAYSRDNPGVTVKTVGVATGASVERDVPAESVLVSEDVSSLSGMGARYTALGGDVLVFADATVLGRTLPLDPTKHFLQAVEVVTEGDDLITRALARDDQGNRGTAGGTDPYYGLVESIVSPGSGTHSRASLTRMATTARNRGYPAPRQVQIPDGATMRCDAPFPIRYLVPGTLIPVHGVTATGRVFRGSYLLSSLTVEQKASEQESVRVTLTPVGQGAVV